ncbi:MAG: serine protease [Bacteroidales bacterium]|jgi:V8-like Glu-specific endopeptidase|nr:serine protease [Bacteroidales bacterium]
MYKPVWNKCQCSVCQLNFYSSSGIKLLSMTGFKVNDQYLITDNNLFKITKAVKVTIVFVNSDGHTENTSVEISMDELKRRIINEIDKEKTFAAVNIDFEEFKSIPSLKLSKENIEIGQNIAVLGYQLDHNNLSIKTGIVSSTLVHENGLNYLQVESNVNQGNSGSPLISLETGEVIGVIGQNLATITQSHRKMKQIINNNLAILKKSQGKFNVEEIDPIQVLIANQNQIKYITNEMYKNATISIGCALNISYVRDLFEEFIDAEVSQSFLKPKIDV